MSEDFRISKDTRAWNPGLCEVLDELLKRVAALDHWSAGEIEHVNQVEQRLAALENSVVFHAGIFEGEVEDAHQRLDTLDRRLAKWAKKVKLE